MLLEAASADAAVTALLRQQHQGRIGEIHGQVGVFFHQGAQLPKSEHVLYGGGAEALAQHVRGLRHHGPAHNELFSQASLMP